MYLDITAKRDKTLPEFLQKDFVYTHDLETYPNLFTGVFKNIEREYTKIVIYDDGETPEGCLDGEGFYEFLTKKKYIFIGYNSQDFDLQVIEFFIRYREKFKKTPTANLLYRFVQKKLIEGDFVPYREGTTRHFTVDVCRLNHFHFRGQHPTSLKWLEFTLRTAKMKDLPIHHTETVSKSKVIEVLRYNKNDVDVTEDFAFANKKSLELRYELFTERKEKTGEKDFSILNLPDSRLGSNIMQDYYTEIRGIFPKHLNKGTNRKKIGVKDIIFDYIKFESKEFNEVLDFFRGITLKQEKTKSGGYQMNLNGVLEYSKEYKGVRYDFGVGGLHGCRGEGIYTSNENYKIRSVDVKSYYPNIGIENKLYPEHLGEWFYQALGKMYKDRGKYPKGTAKNYVLKIALNGSYGLTNTPFDNWLKDPKYTATVTINGQLMLLMLCEKLAKYSDIILANTDGVEVRVSAENDHHVDRIWKEWEQITNLVLEGEYYKKLVVRDINNYSAMNEDGQIKRKGVFQTYEDITDIYGPHSFNKNPSASIIPIAWEKYFHENIPVEKTILEWENIHDFLFGVKGKSNFQYLLFNADEEGVVHGPEKRNERAIRYYISKKGYTMFKQYLSGKLQGRITSMNKKQMVNTAMNISANGLITDKRYTDLNRDWYIQEADELIELIEKSEHSLT